MPIVTLQSPFDTFRGRSKGPSGYGGQVLYPVGQAHYSRGYVEPTNPESNQQTAIRALLAAAAQGFSALTETQADDWRDAAVGVTRKNAAGQDYDLSGANLYNLINLYHTMDGEALTATPPALTTPGNVTAVTTVTQATTNLTINCTHSLGATDLVYVRVTRALSGAARNARTNEFRTITTDFADSIVAQAASPQAIVLPMEEFTLAVGDYIGVELLPIGPTYYPGVAFREVNIEITSP
mgnify:FL=1